MKYLVNWPLLVWLKSRTFKVSRDARHFAPSLARLLRDCETNFTTQNRKKFGFFSMIFFTFHKTKEVFLANEIICIEQMANIRGILKSK